MSEHVLITEDNYEEFLMLQADGELDPAGEAALAQWLQAHPEAAGELAVLSSLRLQPEEEVVYAGKDALLKPVAPQRKTIPLGGPRMRYAAAAALVLALLGAAVAWQAGRQEGEPAAYAVNVNGTAIRRFYDQQQPPARRPKARPAPPRRTTGGTTGGKSVRQTEGPVRLAATQRVPSAPKPAPGLLMPLELPAGAALAGEAVPAPLMAYEAVPQAAMPVEKPRQLPLDVPVASLLREEAGERWQQLRNTAHAVKDANLALRIGNKDLFNIRF